MTDSPALGYLSNPARTEGEQKIALDAAVAAAREQLGGSAETTLTISAGNVTPGAGVSCEFSIDTEAAAAADDLTNIVLTNIRDGELVLLRAANAGRVPTVKHNAGGSGTILLAGAVDFKLTSTTRWLLVKRTGTTLEEIARFYDGSIERAAHEKNLIDCGTSAGSGTVQTCTAAVVPDAWVTGALLVVKSGVTNTGGLTLNPSSLGAKTVKDRAGAALAAGAWLINDTYFLRYDGTDLILLNPQVTADISQGLHTLYFKSGQPNATNGPAVYTGDTATNKVPIVGYAFDATTEESMWFDILLPKSYNAGTITCQPFWTALSGSGGVAWGFSGRVYTDDDAIDQAPGTEIVITDTLLTAGDEHACAATAAITPAGTLSSTPKQLRLKVARKVANAGDTLAVDAILTGIALYMTLNKSTDA